MKQVPGISYLFRRGARYVFYRRIPLDLVGKADVTRADRKKLGTFDKVSLGTNDIDQAKRRLPEEVLKFDKRMEAIRKAHGLRPHDALTAEQVDRFAAAWRRKVIEDLIADPEHARWQTEGGEHSTRDTFADVLADAEDEGLDNGWRATAPEVDALLADEGLKVRHSEEAFRRLCRELLETKRLALSVIDRLRAYERVSAADFVVDKAGEGPRCSEAMAAWIAEKTKGWVQKTRDEHEVWSQRFLEARGDRPLSTYRKQDGREFRALLQKLPKSWTLQPVLKGLGIVEAAEKARSLGLPPMSDKNVNKLVDYVGSFWRWAARHYDEAPPNPFAGLKLALQTSARDERHPFTLEELRTIFSAPRFVGCAGLKQLNEPGAYVPRDRGVFWVPLLALFSGARLGELVQLRTADVLEFGGHWVISIHENAEDMRLKTAHSARVVPVHPELVAFGFLDFVKARRDADDERLFPELKKGEDGYYSSPFSKSFARWLRILGIKDRKNAFHSFRHNFIDARRAAGVSDEQGNALVGHALKGQGARYGVAFRTPAQVVPLVEAMARIRYEGLNLDHLRVAAPKAARRRAS
ncbi:MAG: site-specific integrase [Azospirillum sp.]|nr:site-specific integrase [Azospirillum sp.]